MKRAFIRLVTCVGLIGALVVGRPVVAQEFVGQQGPDGAPVGKPPEPIEPETEAFKSAIEDLRAHLKKMNQVVVKYHIGTMAEDRKWRDRWFELQTEGAVLHQKMVEAALAEFKQNPAGKLRVGEMLMKVLERNFEADRFEGMYELASALLDLGAENELMTHLTMSAFGLHDFDKVDDIAARMQKRGYPEEGITALRDDFTEMKELWAQELKYREEDAAGEPLPRARLRTSKGYIEIELYENNAPETVANFISLVEDGFYDTHDFHRVLEHFMAQTGCPSGDGTGDPGYTIYSEANRPNARNFFRGTVGLALASHKDTGIVEPNSGGSQFFITFMPNLELNGQYTAFGRVVDGMEVLTNLHRINPEEEKGKKKEEQDGMEPDRLIDVEIISKRDHDYQPNKVAK